MAAPHGLDAELDMRPQPPSHPRPPRQPRQRHAPQEHAHAPQPHTPSVALSLRSEVPSPPLARHADAASLACGFGQSHTHANPSGSTFSRGRPTYVNPSGVLFLSERDAEMLQGVEDPFVRFLLMEKANRGVGRASLD